MQYRGSSGSNSSSTTGSIFSSSARRSTTVFFFAFDPALRFTILTFPLPSSPAVTVPDGGGRRRELVRVASTGDACPVVGRLTLLARRRSRGLMDAVGGSAL